MSKDLYWMQVAREVAEESNCSKRQVGAIIVSGNRRIAHACNKAPKACRICNRATCDAEHAEARTIDKMRFNPDTATLYVTYQPCIDCAKEIKAAGITRVVYMDSSNDMSGLNFLRLAGIPFEKLDVKWKWDLE